MTEHRSSSGNSSNTAGESRFVSVTMSAGDAEKLLASNPAEAEARARKILLEYPGNMGAVLLLGAALRLQDNFADAKAVLEPLVEQHPDSVLAQFELGLMLGGLGEHREAVRVLTRAIEFRPEFAKAWYALSEQLDFIQSPTPADKHLQQAREALRGGLPDTAEAIARERLTHDPADAGVLKLLAQSVLRKGRHSEAESLLNRALELEPASRAVRFLFSIVLLAQEKGDRALPSIERLRSDDPCESLYQDLHAAALFQVGEFSQAIAQYEEILAKAPNRPGIWMSYGRALRALGRQQQCVAAFRSAIELHPGWSEAYRVLASVKTYRFEPAEIDAIRAGLARPNLAVTGYAELHFALGKALEDGGQYTEAFDNYAKSASLQRANIAYNADVSTRFLRREMSLYTTEFLRGRAGVGCQSSGPIFIVGMPRAGSTLVQEILCAHSAIERTGELRDLTWMAARLDQEAAKAPGFQRYPDVLWTYDSDRFRMLGEEYLRRTLPRRKLERPFFVDKYPGNFVRTGLIHLMLPNAKIVDIRRHPLDCCLSCFTNYFPEGPLFSHNLTDLGRYYADYVELMAHFDEVLPGKVHRVIYENLVENPESEVRRLFDYLGLPFEEQCLRFYEREQAILTTSTEQARAPIYRSGIGSWQNYEQWLGPLKSSLGPVLGTYPAVPKFFQPMQISMTVRLA